MQPNGTPEGQQTLDEFVGGTDVEVVIAGYSESTAVSSLLAAFESLNISATLPALHTPLLNSAALTVLPTTGHANDTAHVSVSLANPFTADLVITKVESNVTFHDITLGTIDMPVTFSSKGKASTDSPDLDLQLNMDPRALFTVTRILAEEVGLDTDQLDAIVALGGYQYLNGVGGSKSKREDVEKRDNLFTCVSLSSSRSACQHDADGSPSAAGSTSRATSTRRSRS